MPDAYRNGLVLQVREGVHQNDRLIDRSDCDTCSTKIVNMTPSTQRKRSTSRKNAHRGVGECPKATSESRPLLEGERLFSAITNTVPAIVYLYDLEKGCNVYANDGLHRILGYSPEYVRKKGRTLFTTLVHPDDLPGLAAFQKTVQSAPDGTVLEDEHRARHRDGTWRVLHTYESPFSRGADGSVKLKIGVAIDVTERKKSAEALRQSERLASAIANTAPALVYLHDMETDSSVYVNDGFCRVLGYSPVEVRTMGQKLRAELVHPDDLQDTVAFQRKVASAGDGEIVDHEIRIKHRDGTWRVLHAYESPFQRNADGSVKLKIGVAVDVSERRNAENVLRQSEQRLRVALKSSRVTVFSQDRNLRYTWVHNPTPGFKIESVLGKRDSDILLPCDAKPLIRIKRSVLKSGIGQRKELIVHHKEGPRVFDASIEPLRDEQGHVTGVVSAASDITERKRAEVALLQFNATLEKRVAESTAALRESEALLDEVGRIASIGGWEVDLANGTVRWTKALTRIHDLPPETKITLKDGLRFYHGDSRRKVEAAFREACECAKPYDLELELVTAKGNRKWVRIIGFPVIEKGEVVKVRGSFQDITALKQTTEALRESEERFRVITTNTPDHLIVQDRTLRYTLVMNPQLGLTVQQMVGKTDQDILVKTDATRLTRLKRTVLRTGQPLHVETAVTSKTGEPEYFEGEYVPKRNAEGTVDGVIGYFRNVTDRKRAEAKITELYEELKTRSAKLQSLAAELTNAEHKERRRIAYLLHEDLQQRLAAMKYKVENLKHSEGSRAIVETTKRLADALDDTIQVTRDLTSSLAPPVLQELGLRASLEWIATDIMRQYGLVVTVTGDKSMHVCSGNVYPFVLDAVRELLLNVHKHAGVKCAEIRIRPTGNRQVSVAVCDKGKGMATGVKRGEQFGLFSIGERAEAMGMRFDIRSRPGKGTSTVLTLSTL